MRWLLRVAVALAVTLGAVLWVAPAAWASPGAYLRLAHLSPDTPAVDVYVTALADPSASFVLPGVGYGAVSGYRALPAGSYVVSMRPAGAPATTAPVISTGLDLRPGDAATVAGTGKAADLSLRVLQDRLTPPPAGKAAVRCVNGAPSAPTLDLGQAGAADDWVRGLAFADQSPYVDVPTGRWDLRVTPAGRPALTLPVDLPSNSVFTVFVLDRDGSLAATVVRDSAGASVTPVGGVETGYGGTAEPVRSPVPTALAAAALLAVPALACALRRTRPR